MATTSAASAIWTGTLKAGSGKYEAGSGAFAGDYTFLTRFQSAPGTNPEELIAAAHAACFSMALAADLERAGTPATAISTRARCTIDTVDGGARITTMQLTTRGTVPGLDDDAFKAAAAKAKDGCPVSKALAGNVTVELDATLES
ncbi:MAG TPA: OsmC family peroxiredoxin [Gemmatimonadales bacterium]